MKKSEYKNLLTEKDIEKAILSYLNYIGIKAWKQNCGMFIMGGKYGKRAYKSFSDHNGKVIKGMSDIAGIIPKTGQYLAIEVKKEKGIVSPEQAEHIRVVNSIGGVAFVARSVEQVEGELVSKGVLKRTQSENQAPF